MGSRFDYTPQPETNFPFSQLSGLRWPDIRGRINCVSVNDELKRGTGTARSRAAKTASSPLQARLSLIIRPSTAWVIFQSSKWLDNLKM